MEVPPVGLVPRSVREWHRMQEIVEAIDRQLKSDYKVPLSWVYELADLAERYNRLETTKGVDV